MQGSEMNKEASKYQKTLLELEKSGVAAGFVGLSEVECAKQRIFAVERFGSTPLPLKEPRREGSSGHFLLHRAFEDSISYVHLGIKISKPISRSKNDKTPLFNVFYTNVRCYAHVPSESAFSLDDLSSDFDKAIQILMFNAKILHANKTTQYGSFNSKIEERFDNAAARKIYAILRETLQFCIDSHGEDLALVQKIEIGAMLNGSYPSRPSGGPL